MNNSSISQTEAISSQWQILGAGSLGMLWASAILDSEYSCNFLLQDKSYERYKGSFRFQSLQGKSQSYICPARSINNPGKLTQLVVACKAQDTLLAVHSIKNHITKNCSILMLQNGMGIQEEVLKLLPDNPIYCAVMSHGVWRDKDFSAIHAGSGFCVIGGLNSLAQARPLHHLPNKLDGLTLSDNIENQLWKKLIINAVINPLTVKYSCENGELEKHLAEIEYLLKEIILIANSCGQDFEFKEQLDAVLNVIRKTANNRSSMLSDVSQGKTTEIDFINGYLVKHAQKRHIKAPLNEEILKLIPR